MLVRFLMKQTSSIPYPVLIVKLCNLLVIKRICIEISKLRVLFTFTTPLFLASSKLSLDRLCCLHWELTFKENVKSRLKFIHSDQQQALEKLDMIKMIILSQQLRKSYIWMNIFLVFFNEISSVLTPCNCNNNNKEASYLKMYGICSSYDHIQSCLHIDEVVLDVKVKIISSRSPWINKFNSKQAERYNRYIYLKISIDKV